MTRDPLYILAVLCGVVVLSEWLVRRTALQHLGSALLVILITALLANLRLVPAGSTPAAPVPVYDAIFAYVAPIAIFWLLLSCNVRDMLRAGLPLIALFLVGSAGVMVGALLGMRLFGELRALTPLYAAVGGMFTGTYIGGSINFNAVALGEGVVRDGALYAGTVVVDNVVTTVWIIATLALPRLLARRWRRGGGDAAVRAAPLDGIDQDTETVHPLDLALLLALGLAAVLLSNGAAAALDGRGLSIPPILILTTLALLLAQVRPISRLAGTRLLGMFAVYIFLAVIGAFCDLPALWGLGRMGPLLLGFAGTLVLIHGVITFGVARLFGMDLDMAAVASQANVGGSTSALALARSLGRDDLVLPAVLIGSLGNALGTFAGFWAVDLLH